MKVFVTGATGFIGSHLVPRLLQDGHTVHCMVRSPEKAAALEKSGVKIFFGDVTNKASITPGMQTCDWVVHLAGIYSFWEPDKSIYRKVNVEGTRNVMECCLETGIKKVIYTSTVGVWGKPAQIPFNEETPVGPKRFCEYGRTKYEGELIAWEMHKKRGLPLVVIYPAAVLGRGDNRATGRYFKMIFEGKLPFIVFPHSKLSFVYVEDVVFVIQNIFINNNCIGKKYIIAAETKTIQDINKMIAAIACIRPPKISMPNQAVLLFAKLLTLISLFTKLPPYLDLSYELALTLMFGSWANGDKVKKEMNINFANTYQGLSIFFH
jgi:nucleoside-diphosphate-sugar epimerase